MTETNNNYLKTSTFCWIDISKIKERKLVLKLSFFRSLVSVLLNYYLNYILLYCVVKNHDLGVMYDTNLSFNRYCLNISKNHYPILDLLLGRHVMIFQTQLP